jgi:Flp pilus assembly protein TadG
MVTAEAAVVLPVLLVVLIAAIWVLAAVAAQLRCVDAARLGARAAARGDSSASVAATTAALAPADAQVRVDRSGVEVTVVVQAVVRPFGAVLARLPGTPVAARATALVEGPG